MLDISGLNRCYWSILECLLALNFLLNVVAQWLSCWTSDWKVMISNPSTTKLPLLSTWARPLTLNCTVGSCLNYKASAKYVKESVMHHYMVPSIFLTSSAQKPTLGQINVTIYTALFWNSGHAVLKQWSLYLQPNNVFGYKAMHYWNCYPCIWWRYTKSMRTLSPVRNILDLSAVIDLVNHQIFINTIAD